jgi:hypothetical protein
MPQNKGFYYKSIEGTIYFLKKFKKGPISFEETKVMKQQR